MPLHKITNPLVNPSTKGERGLINSDLNQAKEIHVIFRLEIYLSKYWIRSFLWNYECKQQCNLFVHQYGSFGNAMLHIYNIKYYMVGALIGKLIGTALSNPIRAQPG